jgi:hypothetical protein
MTFTVGRSSAASTRSTVDREVVESLKPEVLRSMGYSACKPEPDEPATTSESGKRPSAPSRRSIERT